MTGAVPWSRETGEGPLVALVHGSMDRAASFERMVRHLEGRTVLRYDRRGYGHSLGLGPATGIDEHVEDLARLLAGRPARVFGHSLGGVVALVLAARRPELVAGIVAYESPRPWADWWPAARAGRRAAAEPTDPAAVAERFMIAMVGERRWRRLPGSTRDARRAEGPTLVAELASVRAPNPAPYDDREITRPLIAAHGSGSRPHHQRTARELAASVPGARLEVVEGAGHGVHLTHPAEAAALLDRV